MPPEGREVEDVALGDGDVDEGRGRVVGEGRVGSGGVELGDGEEGRVRRLERGRGARREEAEDLGAVDDEEELLRGVDVRRGRGAARREIRVNGLRVAEAGREGRAGAVGLEGREVLDDLGAVLPEADLGGIAERRGAASSPLADEVADRRGAVRRGREDAAAPFRVDVGAARRDLAVAAAFDEVGVVAQG